MKVLHKQHPFFYSIMAEQEIADTKYRCFKYVRYKEYDGNLVLYNIMSQEFFLLSDNEKKGFYYPNIENKVTCALIKKWFLVPLHFDEIKLSENFERTIDTIRNTNKLKKINSVTILPTTDCNARCFYCYEKGCKIKSMDLTTADAVADFLIKNADGELSICWFGGEPLFNIRAIDRIITRLKNANIKFTSSFTTNGYLFDDHIVRRAVDFWKTKSTQITIDGTEKVYNRIKNYIYKSDKNPFERVMNNIELLLTNKIEVKIRINIDMHNYDDVFDLVDYLIDRFSKHTGLFIYPHPLYDYKDSQGKFVKSTDDKMFIDDKCRQINEIIFRRTGKMQQSLVFKRDVYRCSADNDKAVLIMPDGKLGKCEHYLDDHYIGTVYDEIVDVNELKWFKKLFFPSKECAICDFRPACRRLSCCPGTDIECDDYNRKFVEESANSAIKKIYELSTLPQEEK